MINSEIFQYLLQDILEASSNEKIIDLFNRDEYTSLLERYSLVIGTSFDDSTTFSKNHLLKLNEQYFESSLNKQIFIKTYFSPSTGLLYISKNSKKMFMVDHSIFIDSNAFKLFQDFYYKNKYHDLIELKIKYSLDFNYLPYIFEDYINPFHTKPNPEKTKEKLRVIETINNLDVDYYLKTGEIKIDQQLLNANGFKSIDHLLDNRLFYFNNFFEKEELVSITLANNQGVLHESKSIKQNYHRYMLDFNLICGYLVTILLEQWNEEHDLSEKIITLYEDMISHDRVMLQILCLAYKYFDNPSSVNAFLKFSSDWTYHEIIQATHNMAWDIFLYLFGKYFITNPRKDKIDFDFGVPLYMTEDKKFWEAFVEDYHQSIFLIDNLTEPKNIHSIPCPSKTQENVANIVEKYKMNYGLKAFNQKRDRINKRYASNKQIANEHPKLCATAILYKEKTFFKLKNIHK